MTPTKTERELILAFIQKKITEDTLRQALNKKRN